MYFLSSLFNVSFRKMPHTFFFTMDMKSERTIATLSYVSLQAPRLGKMVSLSKVHPCVYPQYWLLQLTSGAVVSLSYQSIVARRKMKIVTGLECLCLEEIPPINQTVPLSVCVYRFLGFANGKCGETVSFMKCVKKIVFESWRVFFSWSLKFSDYRTFESQSTFIMDLPVFR